MRNNSHTILFHSAHLLVRVYSELYSREHSGFQTFSSPLARSPHTFCSRPSAAEQPLTYFFCRWEMPRFAQCEHFLHVNSRQRCPVCPVSFTRGAPPGCIQGRGHLPQLCGWNVLRRVDTVEFTPSSASRLRSPPPVCCTQCVCE